MKIDRSALIEAVARKLCGAENPEAPSMHADTKMVAQGTAVILPSSHVIVPLWTLHTAMAGEAVDCLIAALGDVVDV